MDDLRIRFRTPQRVVEAVRGVSFTVGREKVGIVGRVRVRQVHDRTGHPAPDAARGRGVTAKQLRFGGTDLLACTERDMLRVRGRRIAMIMQDPRHALDPVMRVGPADRRGHPRGAPRHPGGEPRPGAGDAGIRAHPGPGAVFDLYPHEVSGGMGQRVMIAMMLMPEPSLLIADEPTSALDVTVRLRVLAILDELVTRRAEPRPAVHQP